MKGLVHTEVAPGLLYLINTRSDLGSPVSVCRSPAGAVRDAGLVFNNIIGTLNQAQTELTAGGTAFPFTLPSGFTGLPRRRTSKLTARWWLACTRIARRSASAVAQRAPRYQQVLTTLPGSFLDAAGSLTAGVFSIITGRRGRPGGQQQPGRRTWSRTRSGIRTFKTARRHAGRRFTTKIRGCRPQAAADDRAAAATSFISQPAFALIRSDHSRRG